MTRRKRDMLVAGGLLLVPVMVALASGAFGPTTRPGPSASEQKALDEVMRLADAASGQAAAPKGAPLGAQGAAPQGAPLGAQGAAPQGAPLGAQGAAPTDPNVPEGMQPIRTIPQASLDLVQQIDGNVGDPLNFEKTADGRWTKVTFAALGSYKYEVPDPDEIRKSPTPTKPVKEQIPPKIKELDGAPALVVGFMVPIEITREGKVKSFALTVNQTFCCYGVPPAMNEWIMVNMEEGITADYIMDLPVAAYGSLAVGEEIDDGYVLSVYRMKASEVITAHELLKRTKKPE